MRKILQGVMALAVAVSTVLPSAFIHPVQAEGPLTGSDAYQAIVKIRTFAAGVDYDLVEVANGSGVIINNSGLVLTNNHVIEVTDDFDGSLQDASYAVCLPNTNTDEPDCDYSASLVARNPDLDIALLQLSSIPELSNRSAYPYVALNQSDMTTTGDAVTAIGYPAIGGGTITVSQGTISGKIDKYGKSWIKTDAVTSFGSSGGAALDRDGRVIGITSAVYSDLLGSLGYIINISSVNGWIASNSSASPAVSKLSSRVAAFLKKERSANASFNIFQNAQPFGFGLFKPDNWQFLYAGENQVIVTDMADENGGYANISVVKLPYKTDVKDILPTLKQKMLMSGKLSFLTVKEDKNITISGIPSKKLAIEAIGTTEYYYAIPYANGIIFIEYDYGQDDKDKAGVEQMISKFAISREQPKVTEMKKYTHAAPVFNISVGGDWAIMQQNDKGQPIIIKSKKYKDVQVEVNLKKTDAETKKLNNEGLLKAQKDLITKVNKLSALIDTSFEISASNPHFKLSKNLADVVKMNLTVKATSEKRVLAYETDYQRKIGNDYILTISISTVNPDQKAFAAAEKEAVAMLQNFALGAPAATPAKPAPKPAPKDTDKDGLSDDDEKKYKTNPNKADTDGDGYKDGLEVQNGYNPLGPGRLKK